MSNTSNIVRAGVDSYLIYAEESTYKTDPGSYTKNFGILSSFSPEWSNNLNKIRGSNGPLPSDNTTPTARDAQDILDGNAEGSLSVEIEPQEFRWLKLVMGSESGSGTDADPYEYPQTSGGTDSEKLKYLDIPSITVVASHLYGGSDDASDASYKALGGKVSDATISGSSGEEITASLTIPFAEAVPDDSLETGVAVPSKDVYNFDSSIIEVPNGTTVDNVIQSFELTIENNVSLRHGMGSFTAQDALTGERNFSLSLELDHENVTYLKDVIQSQSSYKSTLFSEVTIKLERSSTSLIAHCLNVKPESDNLSEDFPDPVSESLQLEPELVYFEEVV